MDVAVFSTKPYDRLFLQAARGPHRLHFLEARLVPATAVLARGSPAICAFVNDQAIQGHRQLAGHRDMGTCHTSAVSDAHPRSPLRR